MSENKLANPLTDVSFSSLDLNPKILSGPERAKFIHCTPIQSMTLPPALEGKDVAKRRAEVKAMTQKILDIVEPEARNRAR